MVLCAKFHAKITKFELLYARKSQKSFKNRKNTNLARNFKHITIVINFFHSKPIINTEKCSMPCFMRNEPSLTYFMRESAKNA